jgi:hypothetical protein
MNDEMSFDVNEYDKCYADRCTCVRSDLSKSSPSAREHLLACAQFMKAHDFNDFLRVNHMLASLVFRK